MLLCTFFDYAFACVCILTLLYSSPVCTHHTHISHQESFLSVPASYHLKQVVFSSNMRRSHCPRLNPASKPTCWTSALALSLLFFVSSLHKLTREVVNLLRGLESVCISFCAQGQGWRVCMCFFRGAFWCHVRFISRAVCSAISWEPMRFYPVAFKNEQAQSVIIYQLCESSFN